eukprot:1144699-Pelagomonas_calceolata.AAC.2
MSLFCSLFPSRPPLLLNGYQEVVLGTLFIGTTNVASGGLEVSLCLSGKQGKMFWEGFYLLSVQESAGSVKQDDLCCQCPWRQGLPQEGLC